MWLRFYHALSCDEVKIAYAEKDRIFPRPKLDAGGWTADSCPKSWNQVVADKFNDLNWVLETEAVPYLHYDDYRESKCITFADIDGPITAEQVESRFKDICIALIKIRIEKRHIY
jgi:hypothetical protein